MNRLKGAINYAISYPNSVQPTQLSAPTYPSQELAQHPQMQGLPNPPPSIGYDVNEFRRFFQFGLSQLRYNNKYIINDLTTLASVYHHRMSTYIVKDIEQHLRESHPAHRLVGFYVIDSICKNLGHPFPELFKPFIERLFLIAYRDVEDVDATIKIKFEELLGTWRTGAANQTALFGAEVQRRIEDGVFGSWRRSGAAFDSQAFISGMNQQPAIATPVEKASILYDLRRILSERERIATTHPADQANLTQMVTLQQLEQLITNQQLTINQVEDIRQQLRPMKPPTPPPTQVEYALAQVLPPTLMSQLLSTKQTQLLPQPTTEYADPGSLADLTRLLESNPGILIQAAQHSQAAPTIQPSESLPTTGTPYFTLDVATQHALESVTKLQPPPITTTDVVQKLSQSALFDSQQLAAALASLNPPANTDCPSEVTTRERSIDITHQHSPAPSTLSNSEGASSQHPDPAVEEYENMIASLDIELQNASINRVKPADVADILYSCIPQFCRQDGSRFLYGKTGDSRASEQLDWHFRLQRRVRESGQRAQQRIWSQSESDWIDSHDFGMGNHAEQSKGKAYLVSNGPSNKATSQNLVEKSMLELKKKSVVRPSSPEQASKPCPICREGFETRFDEDEDEFYWTNAIESSKEVGKRVVYHATCHYETIRNKAKMKIKNELEENRLKKICDEKGESRKKSKDLSGCMSPTPIEENLLQIDEKFFGETISPERPIIKVEQITPTLCASTTNVDVPSISLGKRKHLSASDEAQSEIGEEKPFHELSKRPKSH